MDLSRLDTVARVLTGNTTFISGQGLPAFTTNPLNTGAQGQLFPDGWLAIVYPDPYHVDWRSPDGAIARGRVIPYSAVPVDDAQRQTAVMEEAHTRGTSQVRPIAAGGPWPATLPPFLAAALYPAPDGRVIVRRTTDAVLSAVRYDIIDRAGAISDTLLLPTNESIVGVGAHSVYVSVEDPDGIQRLQRYGWPPKS